MTLLSLGLLLSVLAATCLHMRWPLPLYYFSLDQAVRWHAAKGQPDPDILLIDIDEHSLQQLKSQLGAWPWPRSVYAYLVEGLTALQPKAFVFDLLLTEPDLERSADDSYWLETLHRSPSVYLSAVLLADQPTLARPASQLPAALSLRSGPADAGISVLWPLGVEAIPAQVGLINAKADEDGIFRRYPLALHQQQWQFAALPWRFSAQPELPPEPDEIWLTFQSQLAMPYASIRFSDAFALALAPDLTKQALFANKILIIGSSAAGLADLKHTAIAPQQPGMVLLATAIDNVRHQNALRRSSDFWLFPLFIVQLAGLTVLLRRSDSFRRFLLQSSALCLLLGSSVLLLTLWQLTQLRLLAAGPLLFWLALAYLLFNVLAAMDEYLRRQHTISVFGRFLDPRIVADLVGHNAVSVPQKCQLTVLFTDIRGFTSLSEQLAADEVLQLLNRYLDIQVQTLFAHKATLDKFIGDAIMAFWGAPVAQPEQARLALAAAKAMVENLQQFRQSLPAQLQGFDIGIGIHTGEAVVGLLGTGQRTEYTAIGDTINTASRLESASKDYGRVICSEQTVQALGEARAQFPLHHLGDILLKGRQTPVCIYRLGGEDE